MRGANIAVKFFFTWIGFHAGLLYFAFIGLGGFGGGVSINDAALSLILVAIGSWVLFYTLRLIVNESGEFSSHMAFWLALVFTIVPNIAFVASAYEFYDELHCSEPYNDICFFMPESMQ